MTDFHTKFLHAESLYTPVAYTLPNGLQTVNGSSSIGGCQNRCVMTLNTGTTMTLCKCQDNTPVSGVLVDGNTPNIDTTQHETWASGLFTVNEVEQNFTRIGFQFSTNFHLRGIYLAIFNCPAQGIGITAVKVYSSIFFPSFDVTRSSPMMEIQLSDNCNSLSYTSIPINLPDIVSSSVYFVEFSFTVGSNWLYLGEIRFRDVTPTLPTIEGTTIVKEGENSIIHISAIIPELPLGS